MRRTLLPSPFLASVEPSLRFDEAQHIACGEVFIAREMAPTDQAVEAIRQGAGLPDRADRGWIGVSRYGTPDVLEATGLIDHAALEHGRGASYRIELDGRVVDGFVFADPEGYWVEVARVEAAALVEHIRASVSGAAEVVDASGEVGRIAVAGPDSPRLLSALELEEAERLELGEHRVIDVIGEPVRLARSDFVPPMAFELIIPIAAFNNILAVICSWGVRLEMNLLPVGRDAVERMAAGTAG